jgi:lipoprotein NlpD
MGRLNRKKNRIKKYTLFLAVFTLLFVCSEPCFSSGSPKGIYHLVKKGETLADISKFYNVKVRALMEANKIKNPDLLKEGLVLFIPGVPRFSEKEGLKKEEDMPPRMLGSAAVSGTTSDKAELPTSVDQASDIKVNEDKKLKADQVKFRWPVRGKVTRRFGVQPNGMYCNGITIMAKEKNPVLAAAGGKVIFSSLLKDYGETVIVKHKKGYATVYTNLGIRTVAVDDQVKMGDQLGILGKATGKGESYLGFEVRYRNKAVDPLSLLP